jgi:hypothetical protein
MQEVVNFADAKDRNGKKRRTWKTVHHRYKAIPSQSYVSKFRKYLEKHGTKRQKTRTIDEIVYKKFLQSREKALPVHDVDIQRWGLKAAKDLELDDFHASHGWVNNFKSRHKIVSHRLTNIVTKHQIEDSDVIEKSKQEFIKNYYKLLPKYRSSEVINTDQSGIEKEIYSKRTLTTEGEKKVYGLARSKNATTHSYTIQPIISLDGRIVGPMYLCLQEPNGKMGETVKKNLFKPANVVITCSSSGKLTTSLVSYWRDNCLLASIGKKCLLLSDS